MKNKKTIMFFSALLIVIFHMWIYVLGRNPVEMFLKQISYIGVDIFFLLSGYSLGKRRVDRYGAFMLNRVKSVYLKFAVFSIVAFLFTGGKDYAAKAGTLLRTLGFVDLFKNGGGAFLWFVPAIMLFYAIFPVFQWADEKNRKRTAIMVCLIWAVIAVLFTYIFKVKTIFIFWNRLPVFLIGYYLYSLEDTLADDNLRLLLGVLLTVIGGVLVYFFAYNRKLQTPITDMFYLMVIVLAVGLTFLVSFIPEGKWIKIFGSATLEMYAFQMIFGYKIANAVIKYVKVPLATNIIVIIIILAASVLIHELWSCGEKIVLKLVENYRK